MLTRSWKAHLLTLLCSVLLIRAGIHGIQNPELIRIGLILGVGLAGVILTYSLIYVAIYALLEGMNGSKR